MKVKKCFAMILTVLFGVFLGTASLSASEQDTGDPWFADVPENNSLVPKHNNIYQLAPVVPSDQDSGDPWFADIQEDQHTHKPVTLFRVHPRTADHDTGDPWHADTANDNPKGPNSGTTTQ